MDFRLSITTLAATIWASIATIGALAAAFVRWRSTSDETTASLWREEAEAWKAKSERLETALQALERRVEHLENENKMLRALHDNREEMTALRIAVAEGFATLAALITSKENR